MSHADHEWAKEQIAAHLAGGLPADERARLEAHMASCAECIADLDAARRFERQMDDAFAPIRPKAGLEDRVVRALRFSPAQKSRTLASRVTLAAAAVFAMGILGYLIIEMDQGILRNATETVALQEGTPPPQKNVYKQQPSSGATFSLDEPAIATADQLARNGARGTRYAEEADHFESNEKSAHFDGRFKGDSKDLMDQAAAGKPGRPATNESLQKFRADPPKPMEAPAAPPVVAFGMPKQQQEQVYGYADDRRVDANKNGDKPADLYFKPGDAERQEKASEVAKREAKPDAKTAGPAGALKGLANAGQGGQAQPQAAADPQAPNPPPQRKIIRTGEVEYEIESFDAALLTISKLVEEEAGFVGTVNSDKLSNGKVRGTIVLRCPPERLDTLLLKLRGLGELKSQNIRSQDVGKQYYDLESRLKAARAMETRLLDIIAKGKGEIKDLLAAEKELGEWRTKIEAAEGEKRYYDSQIALSTLTVTLLEKEIRSPSAVTQTERVTMSLQVEDVEKAHKDALAAVVEAKGRVTKSDLKQHAAGQYTATLHFEVAPEAALGLRDRFKQLGTVATLDVDRVQETEGGIGKVADLLKVKQKDTQFFVSIYNLANIAPRETVVLSLACADAEASYKTILARVEKAGGRVVTSSLNRQKNDQTSGTLRFEVKSAEADAVLADVRLTGEVMRLDVNENPDTQNVTKSKRGFNVQLFAMGLVDPRESTTLQLATKDVPKAYQGFQDALVEAQARILSAQLNENDRQNVTATFSFEVRKENYAKIDKALADAGEILSRSSARAQDVERVVDSKRRFAITLYNLASIQPRETYTLAVVVDQVESSVTTIESMAAELKGRVVDSQHHRTSDGQYVSKLVLDLPLAATRGAADRIKNFGHMRVFNIARNPQAPEGNLAIGRLEVTISNPDKLLSQDSGPWNRIKGGLSVGLTALSWSLTFVIVGLCFVVPVGGILWIVKKLVKKSKETTPTPAA
jgi:glycine cleavage system regulatory protein